ncbi:DUF2333 family protein [Pelagibius sp. Alg239-R121]|uniref:DUF2333 family protein n=1 Tax=Pelagibius sp. Alg239-R121 TaxID=2993448 RepID=UPI0024A64FFA|nr:DUF2333 family protein [Pelagibius sp. Alg239-R121]
MFSAETRYTVNEWFTTRKKLVIGLIVVVLLLIFYPVSMLIAHKVNADVDFTLAEEELAPGGSRAVAMSIALIDREVEQTGWVANKPFPFPSSLLDNMPNFQIGLMYAMSRFSIELTDELGRSRGSSQVDPDLDKASGLLKYDGKIWIWDPSTSLLPTASADRQYIAGKKALMRYNDRLAQGQAVFDRRADNLIAFLERVGADLGSSSASLDLRANASDAGWFDLYADDVFYATKGRLYGYYMILRELGADYQDIIAEKKVGTVWQKMLDNLRTAAEMDPMIISNGYNDGLMMPSHLAVQGFYLLRARTQLKEVANILLK